MALTQKLLIRQSQALVMTPQLMQAIKLLQLSNLDLATYVEGELERNPLLERTTDEEGGPNEPEIAVSSGVDQDAQPSDWLGESLEIDRTAIESKLDTGLENVFPDRVRRPFGACRKRAAHLFGMGERRLRRPRGQRL